MAARQTINRSLLTRGAFLVALLVAALSLRGCNRMSGTYEAQGGGRIEFSGSNAYITIYPAPTMQAEYSLDGDKVILTVTGEPMVLTRNGDRLEGGPFGMTFVKQ
ncbi:MAG TPA: hypothetical protein VMS30_10625 [Phycisphaerales bacterium]|nr:hypothetical protein [Phycisphaerales bacterium]